MYSLKIEMVIDIKLYVQMKNVLLRQQYKDIQGQENYCFKTKYSTPFCIYLQLILAMARHVRGKNKVELF